jgi:phospholipid/cholesterol/gamma-HCH transport system substrate-binding protein
MDLKIKKEVKIGILVILTVGFFILGYSFLKGRNLFSPSKTYYVMYENVGGLTESAHVFYSGFRIGFVSNIRFTDDMQYLLVRITADGRISLSRDARARIYSSDIMGTRAIELIPGSSPGLHLSGDTLLADYEPDLIEEVKQYFLPLTSRAEGMMASMDSLLLVFQVMLDSDFRENFSNTIESISSTVNSLDTLLTSGDSRVNRIIDNLNSISGNIAGSNEDINAILDNFAAISDSLARSELLATINQLGEVLDEANRLITGVGQGEGTLGKLVTEEELYNNLESASKNLDLLLIELREQPGRFINFSVFGRRRD